VDLTGDGSCSNDFGFCAVSVTLSDVRPYTFSAVASNATGSSAPQTLTITPIPIPKVAISPVTATLALSGQAGFSATLTMPAGSTLPDSSVNWTMSGCGSLTSNGLSATFQAPSALSGGGATCSATVTVSVLGVTASAGITVNNTILTVTPSGAMVFPGKTAGFSVSAANGPIPKDFTWSITVGGCTLPSQSLSAVTVQASSKPGACQLHAASASLPFSQDFSIVVTSNPIQSITVSPAMATMLPNSLQTFTVIANDATGSPVSLPDGYTTSMTGACSITGTSSNLGGVLYVVVKAGPIPKTSCTLTIDSLLGVSGSAKISVGNILLRITAPPNGSKWVLMNASTQLSLSGTLAGASGVSISDIACDSPGAVLGKPDDSGLMSWACNLSQPNLRAGTLSATASASAEGATVSDHVTFKVYGWPPPPDLATNTPVLYRGENLTLTATATDNPSNPSDQKGIANVFISNAANGSVGPMQTSGDSWTAPMTDLPRGNIQFTARSFNLAGAYSQPGSLTVKVLERPTITISSPTAGAVLRSGTMGNLQATLYDPDHVATKVQFYVWGQPLGKIPVGGSVVQLPWKAVTSSGPFTQVTADVYYPDLKDPDGLTLLSASAAPVTFSVFDAPTIVQPATASPNPVNGGLSTTLTVDATSAFGLSGLSWQWTSGAGNPAPVTFDFNGANKTVKAVFSKAGRYHLTATVTDPTGFATPTSTDVVVNAAPQIQPSPAFIVVGGRQSFTPSGQDQFANAIPGSAAWSTTCAPSVGTIDSGGLFSAQGAGTCTVSVSVGGWTGSAPVTVTTNIPPTVQISAISPSNPGFVSPTDISLTAAAFDPDDAVRSVQFFANGAAIGPPLTQAPYTCLWRHMLPGHYYVTALATDVNGATGTSAAIPIAVGNPAVAISRIIPANATTQDNSSTGNDFAFSVEGSGFTPSALFAGSQVYWNGQAVSYTVFQSGDILDSTLIAHLHNGELLNPQTAKIQVSGLKDPANPAAGFNMSPPILFIVDGPPIIRCLGAGAKASCVSGNASVIGDAHASGFVHAAALPPMTSGDQITAVSQYTLGGIQWTLLSESGAVLFTSDFLIGPSFNLSRLPPVPAGNYTMVAQGMNLAGALSSPVSITFALMPSSLSSVRVYPNPWRVDQVPPTPTIRFDVLPPGAQVKIFTISGHWVQTVTADGSGIAQWDLNNSNGERVQSGLYLYLATDSQGGKVHGKFSIIR
jgi:hypothetical protein